jgi:thiamine-phosphate diphosphorylase
MLAWGRAIRELTRTHRLLFVINDRFDLALALGADGVHLGQEDLPPARIPQARRAELIVGRSTHSPDQARAAREEPVDYVAFGPVFGTRSKPTTWEARGLDALAEVVRIAAPRPVVAIGGIDADNAAAVAGAGARAVAVISAVAAADDPVRAVGALVERFGIGA